ncbi:MAG: hypothetical protein K8S23_09820, partial [Candidatus Cloacimonetes bacterium]|nr:hypothetical protein [Candidatus Cloacimonadota bacterium]
QMENHPQIPLLSFRDARILVILQVFGTEKEVIKRLKQMQNRHRKRKYDIDLNYRKQVDNQINLTS